MLRKARNMLDVRIDVECWVGAQALDQHLCQGRKCAFDAHEPSGRALPVPR